MIWDTAQGGFTNSDKFGDDMGLDEEMGKMLDKYWDHG